MREEFWRNRRVLVTGGGGYLGTELVRTLVAAGARVTVFDKRDVRAVFAALGERVEVVIGDLFGTELPTALAAAAPETIFHLAGMPGVATSQQQPRAAFELNARAVWLLLDAVRALPLAPEVVCASSNHIYGEQERLPIPENSPLRGRSVYAVSKICGDLVARAFAAGGLPVTLARFTNTFGADDPHPEHIISSSIRAVLSGERPVIKGNGKDTKGFLFYKDTVSGLLALAERIGELKLGGEAFNFSTTEPIAVLDLVRIIARVLGRPDLEPIVLGDPTAPFEREHLSIEKAKRLLGWEPRWRLEDAIPEAAERVRGRVAVGHGV